MNRARRKFTSSWNTWPVVSCTTACSSNGSTKRTQLRWEGWGQTMGCTARKWCQTPDGMATSRFSHKSIECEVSKTLCFARIHAYHCGQSCSWVSWLKCVIIDKTEWHEVLWVLLRTSRSQREFGVVDFRLEYVTPFPLAVKTHTFQFRIPEKGSMHAKTWAGSDWPLA